ncbi:MAG: DUF3488 and transglutaminase-like domain-containing protein [Lautropia sp.]|nr:DUF3488 and transglutaminase-like domain-containing protein [Lautropia sp.]
MSSARATAHAHPATPPSRGRTRAAHPGPSGQPTAHTGLDQVLRPSLRVLGGRLGGTWERDRRDMLLLMGVALLAVLPHVFYLPFWASAGFAILFIWRLGLLITGSPLPGRGVRIAASLTVACAVYAQFRTLFGQEAGVVLLMLFLGLKLMEIRARRDFFVTLFLCCFLLLTGYLHSQSILMGLGTLMALPLLLAVMLTMQYQDQEVGLRKRLRHAGVLLLQALPVAAALFLLFPRPAGPLWGHNQGGNSGTTGLSDSMSPGDFSSLAKSDSVVMRVEFEGAAPETADMYWRGPSFGHFDGRRWSALPEGVVRHTLPSPEVRIDRQGITHRYTITREPADHHWLLGLETTTSTPAVGGRDTSVLPTFEWVSPAPLGSRVRFSGTASPGAWRGLNESPLSLHPWLQLPEGYNPRTLALARQWRAEHGPNPERLAQRALAWIRHEAFHYTLEPPTLGRHSVDEFLFDTRAGFCEHYSSAFVVLMRALGVPARVVTGYQGADAHEDGYWIVRQANAHAWAEIWSPDNGWLRVDPTAAVAPERIAQGNLQSLQARQAEQEGTLSRATADLKQRWLLSLDGITHQWNLLLLSYDRNSQRRLLDHFGLVAEGWQTLVGLLAAMLALILAVIALVTLRARRPRDPVERLFDEFCQRLAAIGADRLPHETANQFLYRVDRLLDPDNAALAHDIVNSYNHLRYGQGGGSRQGLAQLGALVRAFRP